MKASKSYQESLLASLREPEEAAEYLNAALEEGDEQSFLLALSNVAEANGLSIGTFSPTNSGSFQSPSLNLPLNPSLSLNALLNTLHLRFATAHK
ncbi:MAG TPA: transcriptional regulator [Blastocatellia bacterium]|nr:transcriptional regulator [Blastocatellia bacterium]